MKNPNHYGTVTKLSGNRRKPWIVKEGRSGKQKPIGYALTREEGLILLAQYNHDPWNLETCKITLQELYELWLAKRASKLGAANQSSLKSAYQHCQELKNIRYREIKSYQMQTCIDNCGRGYSTQAAIKNLWSHLDHFALELDIISKCGSDLLTSEPVPETTKQIFTNDEVSRIWDHASLKWADSVLFLLYTGMRISEMLNLKITDIDLENKILKGGNKTAAGKNRIIPIYSKIYPLVRNCCQQSQSGYLFEYKSCKLNVTCYRKFWQELMETLQMEHTPHECRHTFRSRLDSAGANKVCIDRLMGHKSKETGERVYTHKTIEELRQNIELLKI